MTCLEVPRLNINVCVKVPGTYVYVEPLLWGAPGVFFFARANASAHYV